MHRPVAVSPLGDILAASATRAPDTVSVAFPQRSATAADLLDRSRDAARGLYALGVRHGDRVGILMPNCIEFVEVLFGAALLGAVALLVNARYRRSELAYVIHDAGLRTIVTTDLIAERVDFVDLLRDSLADTEATGIVLGRSSPDGFIDREAFGRLARSVAGDTIDAAAAAVPIRSVAIMMYTSGTTALPKGCLLSHEAVVRTAAAIVDRYRLGADDVWWCPLPLFHMGGLLPLCAALLADSRFASMTTFEPAVALRQMKEERATIQFAVFPTLNRELIDHPDFAAADRTAIRLVNAQPGPPDLERAIREAYEHATIVNAYGCTELGGIISLTDPDDPSWPTTSGTPWPGMQARIVDPGTGTDMPPGMRGEIVARGWGMFEGYHGDAALTERAIDADGWFHTGDIGTIDTRGRLTYHGRYKEMLKVGGENVAANEVECFLATHPAVRLAQVVGIPDLQLVEVPAAFIELVPGAQMTERELIDYCRGEIASYKVPRHVRFVESWPMSATKIQKFKLGQDLVRELGLKDRM